MLIRNDFEGQGRDGRVYRGTNYKDHEVRYLIIGDVTCQYSTPFRPEPINMRTICSTAADPSSARAKARELKYGGAAQNVEIVECDPNRSSFRVLDTESYDGE